MKEIIITSQICTNGYSTDRGCLVHPKNENSLPDEALYIARWHSLYSYHDQQEYFQFQSEKDKNLYCQLKLFNKYDLYSKCDDIFDIQELKPYYLKLIKKYFKSEFLYI
jgi:inositol oxygenase